MKKTVTAFVAATAIAIAAVATPNTADARGGWWGPAIGGFAAGAPVRRPPSPTRQTPAAGGCDSGRGPPVPRLRPLPVPLPDAWRDPLDEHGRPVAPAPTEQMV